MITLTTDPSMNQILMYLILKTDYFSLQKALMVTVIMHCYLSMEGYLKLHLKDELINIIWKHQA